MSAVSITAVNVLDNPCPFTSPLQFEVHYECLKDLKEDLDWKLIYVGSAQSEEHDQTLEDISVGPVKAGKFKFVLQADPPDPKTIPKADIVGVTVILLTCSYNGSEFLRVGYYASVNYDDEELKENPPDTPIIDKLSRHIIANEPRVTRFQNFFDDPEPEREDDEDGGIEEAEDDLVVNAEDLRKGDSDALAMEEDNAAANSQAADAADSEDLENGD